MLNNDFTLKDINHLHFICDGMEYKFKPDTGILFNNYGTEVAYVVLDTAKKHYMFIHTGTNELMH